MSQVDTIAEDEEMEFGPIMVDQTPFIILTYLIILIV
jgi:hypothetical protein